MVSFLPIFFFYFQAGIYDKWIVDSIRETKHESRSERSQQQEEEEGERDMGEKKKRKDVEAAKVEEKKGGSAALTVSHLQGLFLLFCLGLLLAEVTFVLEILGSYTHKRSFPSSSSK